MNARPLTEGDVVQLAPHVANLAFAGCFMLVTEPKSWGAQGYVRVPGPDSGDAYYRAKFDEMEFIGRAHWISE